MYSKSISSSPQEVLDSVKASNALHRIAPRLKRISFIPKKNLHTICSFQRMITKYCEFYGSLPVGVISVVFVWVHFCYMRTNSDQDIECFRYTFPCDFARKNNEVDIYGTGGMILEDMKGLLVHLPGLKRLELIDLELDGIDGEIKSWGNKRGERTKGWHNL